MNSNKRHILICGKKKAGKSTMVSRLMDIIERPVAGFKTAILSRYENGVGGVYMYPAGGEAYMSENNHLGDVNRRVLSVNYDVFDSLGVELIHAPEDSVIVMDEIGYMEIRSERFCDEVLRAFDRDTHILATIKSMDDDYKYLNMLRNHPNVNLLLLTVENREEIYEKAAAIVCEWNREATE